jgi:hydrogenase maturation factor
MNIVSSLTSTRLSYELRILVEDAGKFARGPGCLSCFISRAL